MHVTVTGRALAVLLLRIRNLLGWLDTNAKETQFAIHNIHVQLAAGNRAEDIRYFIHYRIREVFLRTRIRIRILFFFSGFQHDKNIRTFGLNILESNQSSKVKSYLQVTIL
jgi:hypothetical protein